MQLLKKDIKSYLLFSSSAILNILKLSPRVYLLPGLVIYPSNICNYDCVMCTNARTKIKNPEIMDFGIMKKIISECSQFTIKPRLHFSGLGEPLLYSKIREVMRLCKQKGLKWSITTNGYLLEKYANDLVLNNCNAMNISIQGNSYLHNKITKTKGSFEKVINGIKKIEEAKKRYKKDRPIIAINCVFNNDNIPYLKNILKEFIKLPINSVTFQHLTFYEKDIDYNSNFLVKDKHKLNKLSRFIEFIEKNKFPIKVNIFPKVRKQNIIRYYTDKNYKRLHGFCIIPWLLVRIYPNGDIGMCSQVFGNISKNSLASIINNKKALTFRDDVRKGRFNSYLCFRCCHKKY